MKKLAIAALALGALALSGCSNRAETLTPDRFAVQEVDGTKCIVFVPYDGSGNGIQMECDFR